MANPNSQPTTSSPVTNEQVSRRSGVTSRLNFKNLRSAPARRSLPAPSGRNRIQANPTPQRDFHSSLDNIQDVQRRGVDDREYSGTPYLERRPLTVINTWSPLHSALFPPQPYGKDEVDTGRSVVVSVDEELSRDEDDFQTSLTASDSPPEIHVTDTAPTIPNVAFNASFDSFDVLIPGETTPVRFSRQEIQAVVLPTSPLPSSLQAGQTVPENATEHDEPHSLKQPPPFLPVVSKIPPFDPYNENYAENPAGKYAAEKYKTRPRPFTMGDFSTMTPPRTPAFNDDVRAKSSLGSELFLSPPASPQSQLHTPNKRALTSINDLPSQKRRPRPITTTGFQTSSIYLIPRKPVASRVSTGFESVKREPELVTPVINAAPPPYSFEPPVLVTREPDSFGSRDVRRPSSIDMVEYYPHFPRSRPRSQSQSRDEIDTVSEVKSKPDLNKPLPPLPVGSQAQSQVQVQVQSQAQVQTQRNSQIIFEPLRPRRKESKREKVSRCLSRACRTAKNFWDYQKYD